MNESLQKILINKSKSQLRVAHIDGGVLYDLEIESIDRERKVDNIFNCEIVSIEPSLEAAFVNFGASRNGFLPLKELAPEYYPDEKDKRDRLSIKDILFEGQKVLVQVSKEERGSKGAALSTFISLAGCYLVLMPNSPKAGGISRRIEGDERDELKSIMNTLKIPDDMGVIVRTAGVGKSIEELQWDLDVLVNLWGAIKEASKSHGAPYLIHQESDVAIRAVRDYLRPNISEILIDDAEVYEKVKAYVERVRPNFVNRVRLYESEVPLFSYCQIESQIESVFQRKVRLPSGGEIVIDRTEALISIDVNSAQATSGGDIETTATNTNLEAGKEVARQLRIRDLGGLFVIDFIDMEFESNNRKVEDGLREAFKTDRARVQFARISKFGLLEMSRQRLRLSLSEAYQVVCPRCHGQGSVRNVQSQSLSILHMIEEKALKESVEQIRVQVPIDIATYLMNEQRSYIQNIEKVYALTILIIPNPYIEKPEYDIKCIESSGGKTGRDNSYEMISTPKVFYEPERLREKKRGWQKEPAVKTVLPTTSSPVSRKTRRKGDGLLKRFFKLLFPKKEQTSRKDSRGYDKQRQYNKNGGQRYDKRYSKGGGYRRTRRSYRESSQDSRGNNSSTLDKSHSRRTEKVNTKRVAPKTEKVDTKRAAPKTEKVDTKRAAPKTERVDTKREVSKQLDKERTIAKSQTPVVAEKPQKQVQLDVGETKKKSYKIVTPLNDIDTGPGDLVQVETHLKDE